MNKIKILVAVIVMGMMLMPSISLATPITATDLGIGYAKSTGLGSRDVRDTVASIIRVALGLLGIVAIVIILIGGFKWMTAGGNEDQTGEAKQWIFNGIIGLAIILAAYALANWVITQLVNATKSTI